MSEELERIADGCEEFAADHQVSSDYAFMFRTLGRIIRKAIHPPAPSEGEKCDARGRLPDGVVLFCECSSGPCQHQCTSGGPCYLERGRTFSMPTESSPSDEGSDLVKRLRKIASDLWGNSSTLNIHAMTIIAADFIERLSSEKATLVRELDEARGESGHFQRRFAEKQQRAESAESKLKIAVEALEIIAGERNHVGKLMSDEDHARAALSKVNQP